MRKFKFNSRGENLMENFLGGKIMERIVNLNKKASERPLGGAFSLKAIGKKIFTTGVAALTLLLGTPHVAWGEDPKTKGRAALVAELQNGYITGEDLKALAQLNEGGLLATGDAATDLPVTIAFGQYPVEQHYVDYDLEAANGEYMTEQNMADTMGFIKKDEIIKKDSPVLWYVSGWDTAGSGTGDVATPGMVLYSKYPLIGSDQVYEDVTSQTFKDTKMEGKPTSQFIDTNGATAFTNGHTYGNLYYSNGCWNKFAFNDKSERVDREGADPSIFANHYGASDLRNGLRKIAGDITDTSVPGYFREIESGLMTKTAVSTDKYKLDDSSNQIVRDDAYTTEDTLYAGHSSGGGSTVVSFSIGSSNDLGINRKYWKGTTWLRSPYPGTYRDALVADPSGGSVTDDHVSSSYVAALAGFKLNLTTVKFASAASAAYPSLCDGENPKGGAIPGGAEGADAPNEISAPSPAEDVADESSEIPDKPLYLRLEADSADAYGSIACDNSTGTVSATGVSAENARIMCVLKGSGSELYQASAPIKEGSATLNINNIKIDELEGQTVTGKAWVESGDRKQTTVYMVAPGDNAVQDLNFTYEYKDPEAEPEPANPTPSETQGSDEVFTLHAIVNAAGQNINCILQDPNGVLPAGTQMRIDVVEPGSARWNELIGQLDATHSVENIAFFEITLYDRDGKPLKMPLDAKVRVLLQIPEGWDRTDLEAVLVQAGADIEFDEDLANIDGVEYLSFWTDHFSPYGMIDKLTEAEKAALKTGEAIAFYTVLDAILLAAAGALVLILTKKRKNI